VDEPPAPLAAAVLEQFERGLARDDIDLDFGLVAGPLQFDLEADLVASAALKTSTRSASTRWSPGRSRRRKRPWGSIPA
jgi:hypothetical protein